MKPSLAMSLASIGLLAALLLPGAAQAQPLPACAKDPAPGCAFAETGKGTFCACAGSSFTVEQAVTLASDAPRPPAAQPKGKDAIQPLAAARTTCRKKIVSGTVVYLCP